MSTLVPNDRPTSSLIDRARQSGPAPLWQPHKTNSSHPRDIEGELTAVRWLDDRFVDGKQNPVLVVVTDSGERWSWCVVHKSAVGEVESAGLYLGCRVAVAYLGQREGSSGAWHSWGVAVEQPAAPRAALDLAPPALPPASQSDDREPFS